MSKSENIDDNYRPLSAPGRIENTSNTPEINNSYTTSHNTSIGTVGCHQSNIHEGEDYFSS